MTTKINKFVKAYFSDWTTWEKVWLFGFTALILILSLIWKDSWIGILASITGIWTVVLTAKGKISNFYFGIANVLLYAYVAYGQKFYGEVMLNILYYLPMTFVAFFVWKKNTVSKERSDDVVVARLSNKARIVLLLISVISVYGYGLFLDKIDGSLPFADSATTVLSVIAMYLLVKRYLEQWIIWIVVDVMTVVMWFIAMMNGGNDISILVMWIAWLLNAVYGYVNWNRMLLNKNKKK